MLSPAEGGERRGEERGGGGGGEEGGPRTDFQEKSRIRGIEVFICKTYWFLIVFYTTCVGAHGGPFSGIVNARDKQVRGFGRAQWGVGEEEAEEKVRETASFA